jgi:hypothetical protein
MGLESFRIRRRFDLWRRRAHRLAHADLQGDHLGELGRDFCHRIFCSIQASSRGEQRADFTEGFVSRAVNNGNGYAVLQPDQTALPIVFIRFETPNTLPNQQFTLDLSCLHPQTHVPVPWANIAQLCPGVTFTQRANVTIAYQPGSLNVSWTSTQTGNATITASLAGNPSSLGATTLPDWEAFKTYVEAISPYQFAFRGQQSNRWRLRTSFHRTGRANLERYSWQDIPALSKHLSSLTKHFST